MPLDIVFKLIFFYSHAMETKTGFDPFLPHLDCDDSESLKRSADFYHLMSKRRTIRQFSSKEVDREVIENCIKTAGTSPSGANKQPWMFAVIESQKIKSKVRIAAEKEEELFYSKRATKSWLADLKKFGTNSYKPYLEMAPYLIAIFYKTYDECYNEKSKTYYAKESTGIATGMLITALHNSGLATLTHTPSPMGFLNEVLDIPACQYKPFLLLVTGHPHKEAQVPKISKKSLKEISRFY